MGWSGWNLPPGCFQRHIDEAANLGAELEHTWCPICRAWIHEDDFDDEGVCLNCGGEERPVAEPVAEPVEATGEEDEISF